MHVFAFRGRSMKQCDRQFIVLVSYIIAHLYINLRRSRDCLCRRGRPADRPGVGLCHRAASFTYFWEVLRCPHKRIVTITKVYIARNNIHVELIRFHKK